MGVYDAFLRGWNAPIGRLLVAALLMLPVSGLIVFALAAIGVSPRWLPALIAPVQLFGSFLIAGRRSRNL